jgi:diguanylate cyclase (GGDEF)-like protein/PAS domain S-box-containing protein/excisionase family DNA binding protein
MAGETARLLADRRAEGAAGLSEVARLIGARLVGGCIIYLRSEVRTELVPVATYHADPREAARIEEFVGAPSAWTSRRVLATLDAGGSVLVSGTPAKLEAWLGGPAARIAGYGVQSLVAVPVRDPDGERIVGALVVWRVGGERYTRADRDALFSLTDALAGAIDRERLAWELRERIASESRAAQQLFLADQRFTAAFHDSAVAQSLFTIGTGPSLLIAVNRRFATLLGRTPEELCEHGSPVEFVHPDDRELGREAMEKLLSGAEDVVTIEQRALPAAGEPVLCRTSLSLVRDASGRPRYGITQTVDIEAQRRDELRLALHVRCQRALAALGRRAAEGVDWESLAAVAADEIAAALDADPVCVLERTGEGADVAVGAAGHALTEPLPDAPSALAARELPRGWLDAGMRAALVAPIGRRGWLAVLAQRPVTFAPDELEFLEAAGHLLAAVEHRREAEERSRRRALLDPLTELPNRTLFGDRVGHAVARAAREGTRLAVVCVDVNRFKDVNETFGHATGDDLIRELATRLSRVLRADDTLARIGGDEFGVLCEVVGDERGAIAAVRRIMAVFDQPVVIDERSLHVSASLGVAVSGGGDASAEGLLRDADTAMHRAKERPGTVYELFDRAMRRRVVERLQLEQDLRRALERHEFVLHYQPLVSLQDRRIVGVEALVRWQHPERGMVSPAEFVPVAEETGLIVPLGRWVLEEACRRHATWRSDPSLSAVYMSVNLSGRQLTVPGLASEIEEILRRTGMEPDQLALELTETVLMEETGSPAAIMQELQELGVRLLLDDFGTGYSSLNYVKRFPLHGLKVDRSFIAGIAEDEGDRAMLRAIVSMATALDVAVIAEGVETLEQASWLASMDCDVAQGFGLARPAAAEAIVPLLRDGLPADRLQWSLEAPTSLPQAQPVASVSEATVPLSEAAEALGVSASTLRRWADTGRIDAVRTPGGHRRFPVSAVRRLSAGGGDTARVALRTVDVPARPLAPLADLLQDRSDLPDMVAGSLYRPGRAGWFASDAGALALAQWTGALAVAARGGRYPGAVEATQRLLGQADYGGASVLERHLFIERLRDTWLRALRDRRATQEDLVDTRRLLVHLGHLALASPG